MVGFSLIVIFCVHHTVQSWHQAWPAMPQGTMDAIPASAWAMALGRNHNETDISKQRTLNTCTSLNAHPDVTDTFKGISAKILGESLQVDITTLPAPGEGRLPFPAPQSGFPQRFIQGIAISAYPPPQYLQDDDGNYLKDDDGNYLKNPQRGMWENKFGKVDDTSKQAATHALNMELLGLQLTYMAVKGVYEGCSEISFIVGLQYVKDEDVHALGEKLRAAYFQQSYLYFGPQIQVNTQAELIQKCGLEPGQETPKVPANNPLANYYREVGLGFEGNDRWQLGNLCEFAAPEKWHNEPYACSIAIDDDRRMMWGPNDQPFQSKEKWLSWNCN